MSIVVRNLHKSYGPAKVVDDVTFEVRSGELVGVLGPSGGGKSTILRIIAGLDTADAGEVWLDGKRVDHLHARDRDVGFVFQHYALFRHMTVADNVGFGLDVRKTARGVRDARVRHLLELMGLAGLGDRYPTQISGGQRQRVALARALAPEPKLLLLDEPFGAVDAKVRDELRRWLRKLHDEVHTTSIFVTHDQDEAFGVSDRVIVMQKGRVEQIGSPVEILDHPSTEFVTRFVGDVNVLEGRVLGGRGVAGSLSAPLLDAVPDGPARIVVRSYDLKFWRDDAGVAKVKRLVPLGDRVRVDAETDDGAPLFAHFPRRSSLLDGIESGCRIQVEVTLARAWPS